VKVNRPPRTRWLEFVVVLFLAPGSLAGEQKAFHQAVGACNEERGLALGRLFVPFDENGWPLQLLSGDLKEYNQARKFRPRAGVAAGQRHRQRPSH